MGKKSKTSKSALNSVEGELATTKQPTETETVQPEVTLEQQQNPYEIPLYSKQAAFALLWLLVYSFGMFTLPFGAFYGTKHILADYFHGFANRCGSVLAAVLVVNVIIVLYALKGFQEADEDERGRKRVEQEATAVASEPKKKEAKKVK